MNLKSTKILKWIPMYFCYNNYKNTHKYKNWLVYIIIYYYNIIIYMININIYTKS